jgi:hypothetical protein
MVATSSAAPYSAPIWPVIIAPLVAGVYYLATKAAFAHSIVSVLGNTATTDIDLSDLTAPQWGSHWFYRGVAEAVSTGFATFVAAGLAHGRERLAAIVAGCTISFGFIAQMAILLSAWKYIDPTNFEAPEPWYQYAIDVVMIFAPPLIGAATAEPAEEFHQEGPNGFGGINRLHFLWLWVALFWYALGLIAPMSRIYALGPESGIIATILTLIINGVPAAAVGIPGYYGLALLTGRHGAVLHPAVRNLAGVLVLVFGFVVGSIVQYGWYWVFQKIHAAIFG